ncbi:hypothetical protein P170DRAFT_406006 [Aspergillus steynii IBT 23096]|uniref:Uncharacterized protein n=1 Tax=Aspergillus steynii IBT 23096 TaxID=1392250 RepID=A0A2I2GCS8_9EURO|nr:uncharacterized protein P170DRAFT_406006 [Aspergillus steynii IBT 23096]PLB50665.1 hypothetical protein P170DRAFT_406006 [Aspergillus steynii IBT 23096]
MERLLSKVKRSARRSTSFIKKQPRDSAPIFAPHIADPPDANRDAPLENLPSELRLHLLSTLMLEELRALVHASPVYHQQYIVDRKRILSQCFDTTLRSITVDAYAVYQSGLPEFARQRSREKVMQCLETYQSRRSLSGDVDSRKYFSLDEATGIVSFHFRIILPLSQFYVSWAFDDIAKQTETPQNSELLSRAEETRLLRALYRFQLCCNLFGVGSHEPPRDLPLQFDSIEILNVFFRLFEPWEVEEIVCIYCFAKERYADIFDRISWDVDEKNPKFDGQRPPTPDGAFDLGNSWVRDTLLKGAISRGLELLYTVLFKMNNHDHLVSTMQERIAWPAGYFLGNEAMGQTAQTLRRRRRPSARDLKQERRDPLLFHGDSLLDVEKGHPPQAWTLIWGGTYSNLYGYYVHDTLHRWGYVMWDAARLESIGASEVLMRQWEEDWGDSDPRDSL